MYRRRVVAMARSVSFLVSSLLRHVLAQVAFLKKGAIAPSSPRQDEPPTRLSVLILKACHLPHVLKVLL